MDTTENDYWRPLSPNQVVAYNLARAREARGWSQEEAGRRLEPHLGTAWSKATFSQAERSIDPGRSRGFTADEIVAFARCFGFPVSWFFLPPPPGAAGVPRRSETGETPRQYGQRLNAVLTQVLGTYGQIGDLHERIAAYAEELTAKTLADAHDIVADASGVLLEEWPTAASELQRWRHALLGVAEGLSAIEAQFARQREATLPEPLQGRDLGEEWADFDLRTIDLGLDTPPTKGKERGRRAGRDL